jgi:hypothetical protein
MTGINLNAQNSYAVLYNSTLTQTTSAPRATNATSVAESTNNNASVGEKLTLSAEAIALSQQSSEPTPPEETPLGGGAGIRPPAETPLGGGGGIRPPETTPLGGGGGIRPPVTP